MLLVSVVLLKFVSLPSARQAMTSSDYKDIYISEESSCEQRGKQREIEEQDEEKEEKEMVRHMNFNEMTETLRTWNDFSFSCSTLNTRCVSSSFYTT